MRPKKDPGIRREAFIRASTELFMEKGYEGVSIRDVLDAVADKTASPSVFYYYFSSKDELYHTCVEAVAENYLDFLQTAFSMEGKSMEEWMIALVEGMEKYMMNERNLIVTGKSTPNRLFVLDMRDRVTNQIVSLWVESLTSSFGMTVAHAQKTAKFLSGGIGEMLFACLFEGKQDQESVYECTEDIVRFAIDVIGLEEEVKKSLMTALKEKHGGERK